MGKTILTPNQQLLLDRAAESQIITSSYYLTGGTALSEFYLKHRVSEDLDFFSEQELSPNDIASWVKTTSGKLESKATFEPLRGQLIYNFSFPGELVRIDFAYFPFPVLGEYLKYKKLRVSSIEDIAVNKLQAILSRIRGRDYFDLYEILVRKILSVDQIRHDYRLKFDVFVPDEQIAKGFTAVLDARDQPKFIKTTDWNKVKSFFLSEAKKLESKIIA